MASLLPALSAPSPAPWWRRAAPSRLGAGGGLCLLLCLALIVGVRSALGAFERQWTFAQFAVALCACSTLAMGLKLLAEWPPYAMAVRTSRLFGAALLVPLALLAMTLPVQRGVGWLCVTLAIVGLTGWFCGSTRSVPWLRRIAIQIVWPEIEAFLFPQPASPELPATQHPVGSVDFPADVDFPRNIGEEHAGREDTIGRIPDPQTSIGDSLRPMPHVAAPSQTSPVIATESHEDEKFVTELQRRTTAEEDLLSGQVVAQFSKGSRQAVVHVPFVPPFAGVPHFECEITDGSPVRVKVAALFNYGARLELRRTEAFNSEQAVPVEIYVSRSMTHQTDAA